MNSAKRIPYIDLAKGICILLVVVDHISNLGYFRAGDYPLNEVFEQTRMPLYFILSGLFFKDYQGGLREFLLRKTNRILIPYLFFTLVLRGAVWFIVKASPRGGLEGGVEGASSIYAPLWFLRCLFLMNVLFAATYYAIQRLTKNAIAREVMLAAAVMLIGIAGYYAGDLRFNIGSAMTSLPFLWAGYVLNRRLHLLQRRIPRGAAVALALVMLAAVHFLYSGENYFYINAYESPLPMLYLTGVTGTLSVLLLSSAIVRLPIVSYVGRYSIIVLCTHSAIVFGLHALLSLLPEAFRGTGWLPSLLFFAAVVALSMLCCRLLSRHLPWFTAQRDLITLP